MEGMLATICDMLNRTNYKSALNIITTLSGDLGTMSKLKGDLDTKKKIFAKLKEDITTLEGDKAKFLLCNDDLEYSF